MELVHLPCWVVDVCVWIAFLYVHKSNREFAPYDVPFFTGVRRAAGKSSDLTGQTPLSHFGARAG